MIRCGYVDTSVGQLHFRVAGAAGPAVVLLHQTASSSRMYEPLMGLLADGFRLYAFDTPGFGASAPIASRVRIEDYVDVLREGVCALGHAEYHLLGHHTGAAIATQWAASYPAEVLSLSAVGALAMGDAERARWLAGVTPTPIDPSGAHIAAAWERVAHIDAAPVVHPPDPQLCHREAVDVLLATPGWDAAYCAVFDHDYEAALDAVACPILIVCGEQDILAPYLPATRARRPDATVLAPPGGAYLLDQDPAAIVPTLTAHLAAACGPRSPSTQTTIERSAL